MTAAYCERWFRQQKRPTRPMSETDARGAHAARHLYTVVLGDNGLPERFLEINNDYVGVGFLDGLKREYLSYQFQEKAPDRLFLSMATYRDFEGDSDRVKSATTYYFGVDGVVTVETQDFSSQFRQEKKVVADVTGNWERYPDFGDYSGLSRLNRDMTPVSG
jgi:hypothetical protein